MSGSVHRVASASALAQLVGQLVSFVQMIVLARLLTPTDIGIFAAGTVLTALLTNFVEGGLQAGLVQRQGDLADADETVFRVTLMVGAAASLGCLAAAPVIGIIFNSRAAGLVAAATAGVVLIHSLTNVPEAVLQREFSVKRRLIVGPAIAVSYAVVAVGLAALGWGVWSMVAGMYASYITWVVSLWMITSWRPGRGHASFAMWRELARFGFPLVLAMIGYSAPHRRRGTRGGPCPEHRRLGLLPVRATDRANSRNGHHPGRSDHFVPRVLPDRRRP